ncbi:hypothetical protein COU60_01800 [Candidatus Pacearchaeota archaeon CG10_big_fil_rev_8_21_14_0_10_34_76]|nr:MAG: hypothetical protein COU60_01800 [Candidatus Pacearchaeota archaeon CG10_big_fil_rev_8_21_14_0_10_34_76]
MTTSHLNISEKYRPKTYPDIIGQDSAKTEIERFLKEFPKKKALLLHGPAGVGKTTLVLTAAKENNIEIFELNSSDLRNRAKLEEVLKPASMQASLFKKGKLLLMDEVDGVTGTDIGGVPELIRIIEKTSHPLIMTCNDVWNSKFSPLRQKSRLVELKPLSTDQITLILQKVAEKEDVKESLHFLRQLAIKSQGDVRAALNDFQIHVLDSTGSTDYLEPREKEDTIFNILKAIFQQRKDFLDIFDNTKMSLDEILLWIEENIPKEYQGEALAKAYHALSNADRFRGRIYKQQFWRFLQYQNIFQSAGISYAKSSPISRFTKYERPQRILKIWLSNQKNAKKKTIAQKYARYAHCSAKRAMKEFPTIKLILQNNPSAYQTLKLTDDEIDFLQKQ